VDKANRILPLRRIIKIKLREGTILIYWKHLSSTETA
jgi:hypothetical protein